MVEQAGSASKPRRNPRLGLEAEWSRTTTSPPSTATSPSTARASRPASSSGAAAWPATRRLLAWIDELPGLKKQPNIVFAAARWHGVPAPGPYAGLREALLADDGTIRATIMARSTQTNEVGRLATLLPAFAAAAPSGPVALIEAGASAGLNLFPDRWGYAWSTPGGEVRLGAPPHLPCAVTGPGAAAVPRCRTSRGGAVST